MPSFTRAITARRRRSRSIRATFTRRRLPSISTAPSAIARRSTFACTPTICTSSRPSPTSSARRPAQPLDLHGAASFDGTVRGSTKAPQIAGQLNASNVSVRGTAFRVLRTSVQASPSQVSLQNGDLELAKQGKLTFNVQSGLHDWSHLPSSPFTITANASQLSIADLAHAANVATPVTGTLSANISAHGTQLNPIGQGEINLRNANVEGEPIQAGECPLPGNRRRGSHQSGDQARGGNDARPDHLLPQAGRL